ncbi:MAG: hypothetical protein JRI25_09260, partial [Deltaproteobacteria bacterium]|nr:hypothetical protein [Deltaproteobacteria bacterium]
SYYAAIDGDHLWLPRYNKKLECLDISDPTTPVQLSLTDLEEAGYSAPQAIALYGDRALVSTVYSLNVVDIFDPTAPEVLGTYPMRNYVNALVTDGSTAWYPFPPGYMALDLSHDGHPHQVAHLPAGAATARTLALHGGYLYSAHRDQGLRILPTDVRPRWVSTTTTHCAGCILVLEVEWDELPFETERAVSCQVPDGACVVTAVDESGKTATVKWTLPATPGDYEMAVTVGWQDWYGAVWEVVRVTP